MPKIPVRNPRNGKIDYEISLLNEVEIAEKCQTLRQNQMQWAFLGIEGRIAALQKWKEGLIKHQIALTQALAHDTGRWHESVLEVQLIGSSIDRWCKIARPFFQPAPPKASAIPFIEIVQDLVPFPLVGVISPWNFPLLLSLIDTLPALLAGCAVVVKPSEITPRFIEPLNLSIQESPELAEVLQYIAGDGKTGSDLLDNIDLVCFTGSVATGRKVYQRAAERFIPAFLELGGKDPALVLQSANLEQATSSLLWGSVVNAGQSCLSIERIYVEEPIFTDFVDLILKKTNQLKFAFPEMEVGQIGPIISDKQVQIIESHLQDALAKGAKILSGGEIEYWGGGAWLFPTILVNVNHSMKVMTEETFGPIMPIMAVKDAYEAIKLANSTVFGLSAAVFAGSKEEAIQIGKKIQAGAISINESALTSMVHEGEKNSFKFSGLGGTRMGASAIKRFMRQQAFLIKQDPIQSPWWWN
jgi:succinate-semialdehyde dehydrogenase / glutarate-semialdehyde dehydrogenase